MCNDKTETVILKEKNKYENTDLQKQNRLDLRS